VAVGAAIDWRPGETILDRFRIVSRLGHGGMGVVHRLDSLSSGRAFAVKAARVPDPGLRRAFLDELQLWLDLPPHPHLVQCYFFRSVEDEVLVFAEYAPGGSLADHLRRAGPIPAERALDLAIQVAWGLETLHARRLVHQDVKPGNVLLGPDGTAKVGDFGLTRARARLRLPAEAGLSVLASRECGTVPYHSPEQAAGVPVSVRTDAWSWGVTMLEMLLGERTWLDGQFAPLVLAELGRDALPPGVAEVLALCFARHPKDRWASLAEAADRLIECYRSLTGREYPLHRPADLPQKAVGPMDRWTGGVIRWDDPLPWLEAALEATGRDAAAAADLLPPRTGNPRSQAVVDLAGFDEAVRAVEHEQEARPELAPLYAAAQFHKGLVHEHLDDWPGAVRAYARSAGAYGMLTKYQPREDWLESLAGASEAASLVVKRTGNLGGAARWNRKAVVALKRLAAAGGRAAGGLLAVSYSNWALILREAGRLTRADRWLARAAERLRQAAASEPQLYRGDESLVWLNRGSLFAALGKLEAAVDAYGRAEDGFAELVADGRAEFRPLLGVSLLNKAQLFAQIRDDAAAIAAGEAAVGALDLLVREEDRHEFAEYLAFALWNLAVAHASRRDHQAADPVYREAIGVLTTMVEDRGQDEHEIDLARLLSEHAFTLAALGRDDEALSLFERAGRVFTRRAAEGESALERDLARLHVQMIGPLLALGRADEAWRLAQGAVEVLDRHADGPGSPDRTQAMEDRASAHLHLAELLNRSHRFEQADREASIAEAFFAGAIRAGRPDLTGHLAACQLQRALAAVGGWDWEAAAEFAGPAAATFERLLASGHADRAGDAEQARRIRHAAETELAGRQP
jgi:serine/threonine protein kinase